MSKRRERTLACVQGDGLGRAWYKMAKQAGGAKKNKSETFGLRRRHPRPALRRRVRQDLLGNARGPLWLPRQAAVMLNGHEICGVKTEHTNCSLTFVLNDDFKARTLPPTCSSWSTAPRWRYLLGEKSGNHLSPQGLRRQELLRAAASTATTSRAANARQSSRFPRSTRTWASSRASSA